MVVCVGEDNSEKYKESGFHETKKSLVVLEWSCNCKNFSL